MGSSGGAPISTRRGDENSGGLHAGAGVGTGAQPAVGAQTLRRRRTWGRAPRMARWERTSGHTRGTRAVELARNRGVEREVRGDLGSARTVFKDRGACRPRSKGWQRAGCG